ncbi:MAG: hypothetical protein BGO55_04495 [Sphingobacteriales bacterium 50-39]|nr:AhpC/TSA family protein [Sphingobacteriales bacterium]OJW55883.1 MAG: hypothetical protein BGO55_04495 [Sphingobacteriales bacterium 50-39]
MKHPIGYTCLFCLALLTHHLLAQSAPGFIIHGAIYGAKDGATVKLYDLDAQHTIDSTRIAKGKFILKGKVDQPAVCWLQCENEYATIMVENLPMIFESPLKNMFLEHKAKSGKEQALISEMERRQYPYNKRYLSAFDSLMHDLYSSDADKSRLKEVFESSQDSSMKIYVEFGKQHANSYYGQDIIYRNRKSIPHDTLDRLYKAMPLTLKTSQKGQGLKVFLYSELAQKGKPMIDFEVRTIGGRPFKLSSLKGKYIYLTFGSAGCGPCRMENKALAASYSKLQPDIEIVTFSLDRHLTDWEKMTREDKISWYNVSDMKGDGEVKNLYNVQSIPVAFLIDRKGIIIERYDGYSENLVHDIEEKIKQ